MDRLGQQHARVVAGMGLVEGVVQGAVTYRADDRRAVVAARNALPLDGDKFVRGSFDELVRVGN